MILRALYWLTTIPNRLTARRHARDLARARNEELASVATAMRDNAINALKAECDMLRVSTGTWKAATRDMAMGMASPFLAPSSPLSSGEDEDSDALPVTTYLLSRDYAVKTDGPVTLPAEMVDWLDGNAAANLQIVTPVAVIEGKPYRGSVGYVQARCIGDTAAVDFKLRFDDAIIATSKGGGE